jgi:hypothetical protein
MLRGHDCDILHTSHRCTHSPHRSVARAEEATNLEQTSTIMRIVPAANLLGLPAILLPVRRALQSSASL